MYAIYRIQVKPAWKVRSGSEGDLFCASFSAGLITKDYCWFSGNSFSILVHKKSDFALIHYLMITC